MILDVLTPTLFGQLLIGGLSAATGCIAYFARKIMKNQDDLRVIYQVVTDLRKDVDILKKNVQNAREVIQDYEKEQQAMHRKITGELSRLGTITDIWFTKWDGVDRRKA